MPNRIRSANARAAAQSYAPTPNGSTITYGLIAAALLLVGAFIAGAFFGADILSNPLLLAGMTIIAFFAGVVLRLWRQWEHARAFEVEYSNRSPEPNSAVGIGVPAQISSGAPQVAPLEMPKTVTFRSPFLLPGLDRPHPPGTFQVWERREPLDVSWNAFVLTKTIMLTGSGTIEALEVKASDLDKALRHDQAGQT